jgi:lipopolysaccharide/colanic/teichoic acid biosynthesis glycosyltransferase
MPHPDSLPTPTGAALRTKRVLDAAASLCALVLLSPVLALTALAVLASDGRPVLFRHVRPGLRGRPFAMLKFRTMRPLRAGDVPYRTDDRRVTRVGRFLRVTSLDELPELWNVLRGDMSLVGPRPLLMEYLAAYTPEEHRRHESRPGMTGWAVVNGRHTLKFRDRLRLDVWYVDHWSLWLDLRILARTVVQVLLRRHVSVTEHAGDLGFPLPPPVAVPAEHASGTAPGIDPTR